MITNTYTTRNDAIELGIIPAIEAGDASRDEFNIEAIADEVITYQDGHFTITDDTDEFWTSVARNTI